MNHIPIKEFFDRQLAAWPDARQRFSDLQNVQTRELAAAGGATLHVQWNPARMVSTGAKIDRKTLAERPCFLCAKNRPAQQLTQMLTGEGGSYELLVNPFPILPMHFTIPLASHEPQRIRGRFGMMLQVARQCPELTVFYNGPRCGASAPDHMHLQAGTTGVLPLQQQWAQLRQQQQPILATDAATLSLLTSFVCPVFVIESTAEAAANSLFNTLYTALAAQTTADEEPPMNILTWLSGERLTTVVIPRRKHRPDCYAAEGDAQRLVSPGALDMAGLIITPRQQDFERITATEAAAILSECGISIDQARAIAHSVSRREEPQVAVGIVSAQLITFTLHGTFLADGHETTGQQQVECRDGRVRWNGHDYRELAFLPCENANEQTAFTLDEVTIGVGFHWQRQERQTFRGELRFVVDGAKVCAINRLPVEQYLESVISSEMSATSSLELLKAHAVISRSWLLALLRKSAQKPDRPMQQQPATAADGSTIRWYDHEDHTLFDVCADDHCQRYQGITRATNPHVAEAIRQTRGEVLVQGVQETEICDTRFSKCCGGVTEEYPYCWENISKPYLQSVSCPWCNTSDRRIIRQVLNDYDQETADFHTWTERVTSRQIAHWLQAKLGLSIGEVTDLIPLERGKSGRIWKLKIVGREGSIVVGKELEIRRLLSDSHLKSSWFDVETIRHDDDTTFILHGHGWGHGVGLCQIGAAVMGERGHRYDQILSHYYQNATLATLY